MHSDTALPVYIQISEHLIREIKAGRLRDGDRLSPEREMAKAYGTTVTTLRKALRLLEEKALIERKQGSGNYVRHREDAGSIYSMFCLELKEGGGLPKARVVSVTLEQKPQGLPDFGKSNAATRIRRLRFLDEHPVALEEIWLDHSVGGLKPEHIKESLYLTYQTQLGIWITKAQDHVSISHVPDWALADFDLQAGAPCGYVERLSWAQEAEPVEFSKTWFDPDKTHYVQRLK